MAADFDPAQNDEDPLERTELARRLRHMQWPPAPPEVKKRVLDRIVSRHRDDLGSDGDGNGNGRTPSKD